MILCDEKQTSSQLNLPMVSRLLFDEGVQLISLSEASLNADGKPVYFAIGLGKELNAV